MLSEFFKQWSMKKLYYWEEKISTKKPRGLLWNGSQVQEYKWQTGSDMSTDSEIIDELIKNCD